MVCDDPRVEDGQELNAAGGEGDLVGLADRLQAPAENLEPPGAVAGDESGGTWRSAKLRPSASDMVPAAGKTAAGRSRESRERGVPATIKAAELRQVSDERRQYE